MKINKLLLLIALLLCQVISAETIQLATNSDTRPGGRNIADPRFTNTIKVTTDYINEELLKKFGADPELYPGVSVAMIYDGDIVWTDAFGHADIENNIAATPDTVYLLASVSKTFAAVLQLKLYDQGLLDLDAPITDCLPEFSMRKRYPDTGTFITPRRLLNHHSGIPEEVESSKFFPYRHWNGYDSFLLEYIKNDYPSQYPGEVGVYNNVAFDLSSTLVSRITGQNYADFAREQLFHPLGMNSTAFGRVYGNMAKGYDANYGIIEPYSPGYGSDGANSSVMDLAQFLLMLQGKGQHPNGKRILNSDTVTQVMATPEISALDVYQPSMKFGLGWDNVEELNLQYAGAAYVKGGSDIGYNSEIGIMLDWKLGVVVLCNHDTIASLPNSTVVKCMQAAVQELGGPAPSPPQLPKVETETNGELIAGYYNHNTDIDQITVIDGGSLKWEKNILTEQSTTSTLTLTDGTYYVDNSNPGGAKYYFKNVEMKDGNHFIMIVEVSPNMVITREKFSPVTISEPWKKRVGKQYLLITFLYDSVSFLIHNLDIRSTTRDNSEFLTLSQIPILPHSSMLAFLAAPVINRNDSCVRAVKNGKNEILIFGGDSFILKDAIPEIIPGQNIAFKLEANQLQWYRTTISTAGEYFIKFPQNARVIIFDLEKGVPIADSKNPWIWNCQQAGTFYIGMVAPRPTNAFLEIKTPYQVLVKATADPGGTAVLPEEQFYAGKAVTITATADAGYNFLSWELEAGDGILENRFSSLTTLTAQSNVTVKAGFASQAESVNLKLNNDGIGQCDPLDTISIRKNQPFTINASPDDGFAFVEWQIQNGTATLDNKYSEQTTVTAETNSVMNAMFRGNPVVPKDKSKLHFKASGLEALLASLKSQQIPLSAAVLADYSQEKVEGVSLAGYYFDLANPGGKSKLKVDQRKKIWNFTGNDAPLNNDIDYENGFDIVLHTTDGVSCYNPHRDVNNQCHFIFDSKKHQQTPAAITGEAMKSFSVGKMNLQTFAGKAGKDSLLISNSTVDTGSAFPEDQPIMITVGHETFHLPSINSDPTHWEKSVTIYSYSNKNYHGGTTKIEFDTGNKTWKFKLTKAGLGGMNFADCPIVRIAIGNYEAAVTLEAEQKLTSK